jgi:phosphomannomutase
VTAGADPALRERARDWMARDPDPETRGELEELLAAGDEAALAERFAGRLAFGTAGLRGAMGAGPMRMNRLVVRESAAGIARHLAGSLDDPRRRGVVVGHDARRRSRAFAEDCAEVIAAHGIPVRLSDGPVPTPVAVFAVREVGAAAGLVVTASHNPPADNGLKLYGADGAQIVPPVDAQVAAAIDAVASDHRLAPAGASPAAVAPLGTAVIDAYAAAALSRVPPPVAPVRIATTAMHGVGGALLGGLLAAAGHAHVHPVAAQEAPDPAFPTLAFPNPEEPGATDLLADRMRETGAAIGLALDPDADRIGVLVAPPGGEPHHLTGDDVGVLLGDWLLAEVTSGPGRLVVSSVVSSSLLARVAEAHGAAHAETLTGFKWLSRPATEHPELVQVLAYEEALGYAIGADVRDKDGLTAALAVASLAAAQVGRGRTLLDALDDLHARHGAHVTDNFSLRDEAPGGDARRSAVVGRLAASPPARIGREEVTRARALADDVLRLDLAGGARVVMRPSGTEPKLKCYCEAVEPVRGGDVGAARARARERLAGLREGLAAVLLA